MLSMIGDIVLALFIVIWAVTLFRGGG